MVYRVVAPQIIFVIVSHPSFTKKGKTMAPKKHASVIWDFPKMIFNGGREFFEKLIAERENRNAGRWLNG